MSYNYERKLTEKFFLKLKILFIIGAALTVQNVYADDPLDYSSQCKLLNDYGIKNKQNLVGRMVGCWKAETQQFSCVRSGVMGGPELPECTAKSPTAIDTGGAITAYLVINLLNKSNPVQKCFSSMGIIESDNIKSDIVRADLFNKSGKSTNFFKYYLATSNSEEKIVISDVIINPPSKNFPFQTGTSLGEKGVTFVRDRSPMASLPDFPPIAANGDGGVLNFILNHYGGNNGCSFDERIFSILPKTKP